MCPGLASPGRKSWAARPAAGKVALSSSASPLLMCSCSCCPRKVSSSRSTPPEVSTLPTFSSRVNCFSARLQRPPFVEARVASCKSSLCGPGCVTTWSAPRGSPSSLLVVTPSRDSGKVCPRRGSSDPRTSWPARPAVDIVPPLLSAWVLLIHSCSRCSFKAFSSFATPPDISTSLTLSRENCFSARLRRPHVVKARLASGRPLLCGPGRATACSAPRGSPSTQLA